MIRGLSLYASGWTGSVTVDDGVTPVVITPADHDSPFRVLDALVAQAQVDIDSSFAWALAAAKVRLTCDVAFTLALTGTTMRRLGFSSGSYASATSRTAEAQSDYVIAPYSDHVCWLALDLPHNPARGVSMYDTAYRSGTPGTDHRYASIVLEGLRSVTLDTVTRLNRVTTPLMLDTADDDYLVTSYDIVRLNESQQQSDASGFARVRVEVVR